MSLASFAFILTGVLLNAGAQLLLKGSNRRQMRSLLQRALAARSDLARRTIVDVDPISVL